MKKAKTAAAPKEKAPDRVQEIVAGIRRLVAAQVGSTRREG